MMDAINKCQEQGLTYCGAVSSIIESCNLETYQVPNPGDSRYSTTHVLCRASAVVIGVDSEE